MTTKLLEVVVCDLCRVDRPAVAHHEIDVCVNHDAKLAERKEESLYGCEQCDRQYRDPSRLRRHVATAHGKGNKNTCPYCGKNDLKGETGVNRHIGQKHREELE